MPLDAAAVASPIETGRALVASLGIEHAEFGSDLLTGNVEVRLLFDSGILGAARDWLTVAGVAFELEVR